LVVPRVGKIDPMEALSSYGFARVAAAVPTVELADGPANVDATIAMAREGAADGVAVLVFPELGLVGYSNQDLFHQQVLLDAADDALLAVVAGTADLATMVVVGLPLRVGDRLFNVAAVVHHGEVLGIVPKSYLPNYREFYEKRHFSAARDARTDTVVLDGRDVPFGTDLLFEVGAQPDLVLGVEICEDLWAPVPPSTYAAMAGATVLVNLSGSNLTIGKAGYRRQLCSAHSARTLTAYVYAGAGEDESTTDLAWDGHAIIAENGNVLAESAPFADDGQFVVADIDLDRLLADRLRTTSFVDCAHEHRDRTRVRRIRTDRRWRPVPSELRRHVPRFPFVPGNPAERAERCAEVYAIQRSGLRTRLRGSGIDRIVIGVSGGIDSTQALLVAVGCMDDLSLPRTNVLGYTLPGFATSRRTLDNAHRLMDALGVEPHEIDIKPASMQMLRDLEHPAASGSRQHDVTYENVQAGARTSLLFRLANQHDALVLGTGDLSELALGWCTYGVGDHMSHYGVNASVPKTLIQYLVQWVSEHEDLDELTRTTLDDILATGVSPELVPHDDAEDGGADGPAQLSEDVVGPYELQDFFLYHVLRFGYRPSKVALLAHHAWRDRDQGEWPAARADAPHNQYDLDEVCRWLRVFLRRFFTNQFKRSALPDGPKVGSGGSLSPRGDWRAPSDVSPAAWLRELDEFEARIAAAP
jgi:NAD+ synthase (glutamine-hydrolysing)